MIASRALEDIILYCACFQSSERKYVETESLEGELGEEEPKKSQVCEEETLKNILEQSWKEEVIENGGMSSTLVVDYKPAVYVTEKNEDEKTEKATLKFVDPEKPPLLFVLPWAGFSRDLGDPTKDSLLKSPLKRAEDAAWYGCDELGQIWRFVDTRRTPYGKTRR